MMRLIDADALMEQFNEKCDMATVLVDEKTAERFYTFCILADAVEDAPTIDAEPVRHGRWIEAHDNDGLDYECSNRKCQCRISYNGAKVSGDFNYCPNCGAKMDEEDTW